MLNWPVVLTTHAREQLADRCSGITPEQASEEVRQGLALGNHSGEKPWWASDGKHARQSWGGFYTWPEGRDRVYVVRAGHSGPDPAYIVVTVWEREHGR